MSDIFKAKEKGNLIVISGPSGAGKGTIVHEILNRMDNVWLSISMTTREVRSNEIPDQSYFFVSKERFEEMCALQCTEEDIQDSEEKA